MKTWSLFRASMLRWWRDPTALFFTIFFPLIFLLIFGSIFGGDNSSINARISLHNNSDSQQSQLVEKAIKDSNFFEIKDYTDHTEELTDLKEDRIDMVVTIPEEFGQQNEAGIPSGQLEVEYLGSDSDDAQIVISILDSILSQMSAQYQNYQPTFSVSSEIVSGKGLKGLDYMIPGILSISVLTISLFGMAAGFTEDKKTGALARLRSAPIRTYHVVLSTAIAYMLMGILTLLILLAVARVVYDWSIVGSLFSFLTFGLISLIGMFGIGLCIGGWAKNERQAIPIAQAIGMPMMFLSGAFFPKSIMPEWLLSVSQYLPLTYVAEGFRLIGIENYGLLDVGKQIAVMALVAAITYPLAFKIFRWG